jgi:hypothetical protein
MRFYRSKIVLGFIAVVCAISACNKGGGSSDDSSSSDTGGDSADTAVMMSGTLALTSDAPALALTAGAYNLYCVTFTDIPNACKIDVDGAGGFSKDCEDFANKAFGCFLRQDAVTLAAIEFDLGSAMSVGGGALVFDVNFDAATGMAFAKVDQSASSSLDSAVAGEATSMTLAGNWKLSCADGGDAEIGDCDGKLPPEGFSLAFTTFDVGGQSKLAMWDSENRHDVCVAGGSEAIPNFRINFSGKDYKFDYSSKATFESSVDAMFAGMPSEVKTEIIKFAKNRGHNDFCSNQPEVGDCKIVSPGIEEVKVPDPNAPSGMRTEMRPKDIADSDFDTLKAYTGATVANTWKCAINPENQAPGVPPCGGNMKDDDGDGFGGGTNYMTSDNKPLMLLCKNDNGVMRFPMTAATAADSLKAATTGSSSDCKKVSYAGGSYLQGDVEEIRRAAYELFRVENRGGPDGDSDDPSKMCASLEIPENFTFASCSKNKEQAGCHIKNQLQHYGLKMGSNKLVASGEAMMDARTGDIVCPVAAAALKESHDQDAYQTFNNACRDEVVGLSSLVAQLRALMKAQALYRPMGEAIICSRPAADPLRVKLLATLKASCIADVEYNKMCFEGGVCETTMSCRGSSNGGKCMNDDGTMFTGRINGRDELMDLKMLTDGAFSISSSALEKYYRFDQESNKPVACTYAKQFSINGRKVDDDSFTGVVTEAGKQSCEGQSSGGGKLTGDDDDDDEGGGNFTIPIQATRL